MISRLCNCISGLTVLYLVDIIILVIRLDKRLFNLGMVVGRFEPIHLGHERIINIALNSCNKTALLVTYNKANRRNPYSFEYIIRLINKIYPKEIEEGKLQIIPFKNDIAFDEKYGEKLITTVRNMCFENPDFIVYGNDKDISKCFSDVSRKDLFEVKVDRGEFNISATDIRYALQNGNIEFVKKYLDPKIYDEIPNLKYYNDKLM